MHINNLHDWGINTQQARDIQLDLATKVIRKNHVNIPHLVAGLDVSVNRQGEALAVALVLTYP